MQIVDKKNIKKFQQGGEMTAAAPEEQVAPEQLEQSQDPMAEIIGAFQEAVNSNNCELCMKAAQTLLQVIALQLQAQQPQEAPVYQKCGGRMVKKSKKSKK